MSTPPARPHRWFTFSLAVLLAVCVLGRFVKLEMDAPYGIISTSGAFLSDEGFYSKSAQLYAKFGDWTNPHDFVWRSHNALFTCIQASVFSWLGASLAVARGISVASLVVSIAAFYGICRRAQSRTIALVSCLLVALTLQNFAYSRLALIEPMGTAFSLVALWVWVRFPRRWWMPPAALLVAGAAVFVKVSFLYAMVAVSMLIVGEAILGMRTQATEDDPGTASGWKFDGRRLIPIAWVAGISVALYVIQGRVVEWAAEDGALFQKWHVDSRVAAVSIDQFIEVGRNELKALYKLCYATGATALTCSLGFGIVFQLLKKRVNRTSVFGVSRATIAMVLWCAGGVSFFGLFDYQPPRYFYFAIFPVAYATVMMAGAVSGDRHWRLTCLYILFLHAATQFPGYQEWASRRGAGHKDEKLHTYRDHAHEILWQMQLEDDDRPVVLMGGVAPFIALFDERIRPLSYLPEDDLHGRLEYWKPPYLIASRTEAAKAYARCPDLIEKAEIVASYALLGNYYFGEDHVLMKLTYHD